MGQVPLLPLLVGRPWQHMTWCHQKWIFSCTMLRPQPKKWEKNLKMLLNQKGLNQEGPFFGTILRTGRNFGSTFSAVLTCVIGFKKDHNFIVKETKFQWITNWCNTNFLICPLSVKLELGIHYTDRHCFRFYKFFSFYVWFLRYFLLQLCGRASATPTITPCAFVWMSAHRHESCSHATKPEEQAISWPVRSTFFIFLSDNFPAGCRHLHFPSKTGNKIRA